MMCATLAIAGVLIDRWLGEPARAHPLVGFGLLAGKIERALNPASTASRRSAAPPAQAARPSSLRLRGIVAWSLAVLPPVVVAIWLTTWLPPWGQVVAHVAMLWFAIGGKSLDQHIAPVGEALATGDLVRARHLAGRVVSRELTDADETAIARAAVESALENGNDAVFAALFWFALAGGPGVVAFRLINTLDAMWGYRTPRFLYFGWAAAKIDDVANWLPARLTALTYAAFGARALAWHCWRTQAPAWDSPNAGPVMAAGAGSLQVRLGGTARYHGVDEVRPILGSGPAPRAADVGRALRLVKAGTASWLLVLAFFGWAIPMIDALPPALHALIVDRTTDAPHSHTSQPH